MRVLVIFCHPDENSFSGTCHKAVIQSLTAAGHCVTDLDLYAENFNPVMARKQHAIYEDPSRYVETVRKYADQLARSEALVVVYPTWWYGLPAMLKGYFDQVWAPGIAFDIEADGSVDTNRLGHIRRIGVVTTYGAPWWLIRFYMGDPERKFWSRGVRQLCARGCRLDWRAKYDMDKVPRASLDRFIARVRRTMAAW